MKRKKGYIFSIETIVVFLVLLVTAGLLLWYVTNGFKGVKKITSGFMECEAEGAGAHCAKECSATEDSVYFASCGEKGSYCCIPRT